MKNFGFECEQTIIVNGVKMSLAEYKKMKMKPKNDAKKAKREKVLLELSNHCNGLIKEFKLPKSLCAYYDNGYKQWGTIARTIINNDKIRSPFVDVRCRVIDINKQLEDIATLGKKSDKAIFGYIERLGYLTDDLKNAVQTLADNVSQSGVIRQYRTHECINGCGRRLGLQTLISRTCVAIGKMQDAIKEFDKIAKNGLDISEYDPSSTTRLINA